MAGCPYLVGFILWAFLMSMTLEHVSRSHQTQSWKIQKKCKNCNKIDYFKILKRNWCFFSNRETQKSYFTLFYPTVSHHYSVYIVSAAQICAIIFFLETLFPVVNSICIQLPFCLALTSRGVQKNIFRKELGGTFSMQQY